MRVPLSVGLGAVTLLLLAGAPLRQAVAEDDVVIHVPADMGMEDFLTSVAEATGKPLVWNPLDKNVRGKRLKGGLDLRAPRRELFGLVRGVLAFYELTLLPVGPEGHEVVLVMDARQTSAILKLKPLNVTLTEDNLARYAHADGLFITTSIAVQHMEDLRSARNALTRIVTGGNVGNVTEVPATRSFVVTDFAPNVVAIYRLLKTMDQPQPRPSTTSGVTVAVALQHARARDLAAVLTQHIAARPATAGRTPQRGPAPASTTPSIPRITPDARTNRILVTGTEAEVVWVKSTITLLDVAVPQTSQRTPTPTPKVQISAHLIRLSYVQAAPAARTLSILIGNAPALWASARQRPNVVAHEETNALLIACSDADLTWIRALVRELDTKTP